MVKPRLNEQEEEVSATLLYVLRETLALAHPMVPFVTEEIHSFLPGADGDLAVSPYPRSTPACSTTRRSGRSER